MARIWAVLCGLLANYKTKTTAILICLKTNEKASIGLHEKSRVSVTSSKEPFHYDQDSKINTQK